MMEQPESQAAKMAEFLEEIRQPDVAAHFVRDRAVRPEDLTGADGAIWQELKNKTLTKAELEKYESEVEASGNASRHNFLGMIRNRALGLFLEQEIEERRKNK